MLTAVATLGFLFSCNKDEETFDAPVISVESSQLDETNTFEGEPGAALSYTINITAEAGFVTLYANDAVADEKDPETTPTTWSYQSSDQLPDEEGTYTLEYYAIDEEGQESNHITITIIVTSPAARSYSAVLLAAPLGDLSGESFFSVESGTPYSPETVTGTSESISPTIDFGYYYGENDLATIASPEGFKSTIYSAQVEGWNITNSTTLKTTTLESSDFTEVVSWADIDAEYDAGVLDENAIVSGLVAGNVLAFETTGGIRGLILVKEIIDGNQDGFYDGSTDEISLDIIAQLSAETE